MEKDNRKVKEEILSQDLMQAAEERSVLEGEAVKLVEPTEAAPEAEEVETETAEEAEARINAEIEAEVDAEMAAEAEAAPKAADEIVPEIETDTQLETTEDSTFEDEDDEGTVGKKKKRKGRYKFHLERAEYSWLLMNMGVLNGSYNKNMRTAKIILVICFIPLLDAVLHPGNLLALAAAMVLMLVALQIKNQGKKATKRALKTIPNGMTLLVESGEKGLLLQEPGRPQVVLPYDHIVKVYQHGGYGKKEYLSIQTGPKTSMYILRDTEHKGYRAIERRLKERLLNRYEVVVEDAPKKKR